MNTLKIFVNKNNICQINIFAKRNNIHEMKLRRIGIGIYLWPKNQRIDSWQIYSQTIHKLFANRELFAEHWNIPIEIMAILSKTYYTWNCVCVQFVTCLVWGDTGDPWGHSRTLRPNLNMYLHFDLLLEGGSLMVQPYKKESLLRMNRDDIAWRPW